MKWKVSPEETGQKLQMFLKGKLPPEFSARAIKREIEANQCYVNGNVERFASHILAAGDCVEFVIIEEKRMPLQFEKDRVLYEDADLLAYDKPAGIASDDPQLLKIVQRQQPFLKLVHRLDRDTTGVLLFAKTVECLEKMILLFKQHKIHKEYLAIIDGVPQKDSGTVDNFLGEIRRYQGQVVWGTVAKSKGLHAHTEWKLLKRGEKCALLRCVPTTGRTHQIRVHLNSVGHPILGDFQYGRRFHCSYRAKRCLLHAEKMAFQHPMKQENIDLQAELPKDFQEALQELFG